MTATEDLRLPPALAAALAQPFDCRRGEGVAFEPCEAATGPTPTGPPNPTRPPPT